MYFTPTVQSAVLVAFAVKVKSEFAAQTLLTLLLPGAPTVLEAIPKYAVEVAIVITGKVFELAFDAGAAVEEVATVNVSEARPAPVYAVFDVPTPSQETSSEVMKRSFPSLFRIDVDVALAPGAAKLIAIIACFASPKVDPAGDAPRFAFGYDTPK